MYLNDFYPGQTFDTKFCTVQGSGAPTTLSGSPVISAYIGNSVTQLTAGITLSVDFDGVTGANNIRVVPTVANGYTSGSDFQLMITTGTVNGVSVVGYVPREFSILNRTAITGIVAAASGLCQAGSTATTCVLPSTASASDGAYVGFQIEPVLGTGADTQARRVVSYVGATRTVTFDASLTTFDGTTVVLVRRVAPASASAPAPVEVTRWNGGAVPATNVAGVPIVDLKYTLGTISPATAGSVRADALTDAAAVVTAVFAHAFGANYGAKTFEQLIGKLVSMNTGPTSGAGTGTEIFKTPVNAVTDVTIANDGTNRTATTLA